MLINSTYSENHLDNSGQMKVKIIDLPIIEGLSWNLSFIGEEIRHKFNIEFTYLIYDLSGVF
jgi:hypothetical protein